MVKLVFSPYLSKNWKIMEDVRATCTYLIFLPSSNDVIYFLFKNNTHLSFPSINNDVNYCPSKRKNGVNYGANVCAKESMCMLKESNIWVQEMGIRNCWCKK